MHRRGSPVVLGILLVLVGLRPVLLDHCLLACAGDSTTSTPGCHHATEPHGSRLEAPPHACGHDHGAVVLAANTTASHDPTVSLAFAWEAVSVDRIAFALSASQSYPHSPPHNAARVAASVSTPLRL